MFGGGGLRLIYGTTFVLLFWWAYIWGELMFRREGACIPNFTVINFTLELWYKHRTLIVEITHKTWTSIKTLGSKKATTWRLKNLKVTIPKQSPRGVLKKIAIFTGKHLCNSIFLTNLQAAACNFIKRNPGRSAICQFYEIFEKAFFMGTPLVAASDTINFYEKKCLPSYHME